MSIESSEVHLRVSQRTDWPVWLLLVSADGLITLKQLVDNDIYVYELFGQSDYFAELILDVNETLYLFVEAHFIMLIL